MATSSSPDRSNVTTLKLLIDSNEKRVLFAEAGKDFVDFLFSLLYLPVGTFMRLLSTNGMVVVEALGKLYQSFESLSYTHMQPNVNKDILFRPTSLIGSSSLSHLSPINTISRDLGYVFPLAPTFGRSSAEEGGFVKGVVTYMIMDNLEVKRMSTISSITIINKFNVKEFGELEEKTVSVGIEEGLKLLRASMESKTVLTDIFLRKEVNIVPPIQSACLVFGQFNGASSSSVFSFNSSSATTSTQPVFGSPNPFAFSAPSSKNDQMNMEDSMAEDTVQASGTTASPVGQQPVSPSPPSFVFGSTAPLFGNPFPFGSQPNLANPQNPCPFQASGRLGSNFSLGIGGSGIDKSNRKFVKVKHKQRMK